MCDRNPRNCALGGTHDGPCLSVDRLIEQQTEELMDDLKEESQ